MDSAKNIRQNCSRVNFLIFPKHSTTHLCGSIRAIYIRKNWPKTLKFTRFVKFKRFIFANIPSFIYAGSINPLCLLFIYGKCNALFVHKIIRKANELYLKYPGAETSEYLVLRLRKIFHVVYA